MDLEGKQKISGILTKEVLKVTMRTLLSSFSLKDDSWEDKEIAAVNISSGMP